MPRQLIRIVLAALAGLTVVVTAAAASPTVQVLLATGGPVITGPTTWRPGAARIQTTSQQNDQEITLLRFRPGYTYADFLADGRKAHSRGPAARAAVAHVYAHTIFAGGLDLFRGQSAGFTVDVKPGTYYLGEMTNRPQLTRIHVAGVRTRTTTGSAATITATNAGFRVSGPLPANGTTTFANASSAPQRFNLIPVKPGTTRAQLVAYIHKYGLGENAPPPSFALDGPQIGTADLSPKQRMQLSYRLPAGTYAGVDFDHASLAAVVTLR